uniref:Uncharacterized protein n=1 Tax=Meloidogyne enterolobii TaxID=390850 RepID=A0A6V7WFS5_MELEN|nr:unnamed protein product [Meloidogyne enterolobii]
MKILMFVIISYILLDVKAHSKNKFLSTIAARDALYRLCLHQEKVDYIEQYKKLCDQTLAVSQASGLVNCQEAISLAELLGACKEGINYAERTFCNIVSNPNECCCMENLKKVVGVVDKNCIIISAAAEAYAKEVCAMAKIFAVAASKKGCFESTKLAGQKAKNVCYSLLIGEEENGEIKNF